MSETDRELLELAAKAAGYEYAKHGGYIVIDGIPGNWNPLTDDGDALRLAVKLRIEPHFVGNHVQGVILQGTAIGAWEATLSEQPISADPYAATRRAIVRAAAEMEGA